MATQKLYAGAKLRETRLKLGLTQKAFSERLGISLPYLNQMENNNRPVSTTVVLALAQVLGEEFAGPGVLELGGAIGEAVTGAAQGVEVAAAGAEAGAGFALVTHGRLEVITE